MQVPENNWYRTVMALEMSSEGLTELNSFSRALLQKLDAFVRQTHHMENEYASSKGGKEPVNSTQKPAVGVKEAATSKEGLKPTTNKHMGMTAMSPTQANPDTEMEQPTHETITKAIGNSTHGKLNWE